jgi:glycosyltransferase involved in cell wall biosynthesis
MNPAAMRVAVLCDYAEEQWPSMDICANMLLEHLQPCGTRIQPRLIRRFSRVAGAAWALNADRLINRHIDYPLRARALRDFDIFHITDHSYAQLVHALPAERTVVTCHDTDTFRCLIDPAGEPRPRWFRAMARRTLTGMQRAAAVVCVSNATRAGLIRNGLIAPEKITVAPNGVDPVFSAEPSSNWDHEADRLLGAAQDRLDILHVGSTIPRKRIDLLLRIFAEAKRMHPGARLIRVGAPFNADQKRLATELGVSGNIVELPFIPPDLLAAVYRRASVVLVPSEAEGFGLPLLESMACGTPVIASDLAALRETGGSAAEFYPVGDVISWAEAVSRLASDPEHRNTKAVAGLTRAAEFSWAGNTREVNSLYKTILFRTQEIRAQEKDHHHWRGRLHRL